MDRLEETLGVDRRATLLALGLRSLPDEQFTAARRKYEATGGLDGYLKQKGEDLLLQLERIRAEGGLFFCQPVTREVIEFVRRDPEILSGRREGSILYEKKIPYKAHEYLLETDPARRAYAYCHCPWVRESFRDGGSPISAAFCNCSAASHRKPWEVFFGHPLRSEVVASVLNGDPWCRFAIHLPR